MNFENLSPMSINDYLPKCNEIILSYRKSELFVKCTKRQSIRKCKEIKNASRFFSVQISMC